MASAQKESANYCQKLIDRYNNYLISLSSKIDSFEWQIKMTILHQKQGIGIDRPIAKVMTNKYGRFTVVEESEPFDPKSATTIDIKSMQEKVHEFQTKILIKLKKELNSIDNEIFGNLTLFSPEDKTRLEEFLVTNSFDNEEQLRQIFKVMQKELSRLIDKPELSGDDKKTIMANFKPVEITSETQLTRPRPR